uniref:Uncharacterized protein LOC114339420 n=1 Tax=Diabrotica virgifera virgifera TaxID=50390 RepID=A0A6P7GKX8_DIAVI
MIEMALEEDLPEEFKGGTLRIHPDRSDPPKSPNPAVNKIDNASEINNQGNNYNWRGTFMAPLSSIPNKSAAASNGPNKTAQGAKYLPVTTSRGPRQPLDNFYH